MGAVNDAAPGRPREPRQTELHSGHQKSAHRCSASRRCHSGSRRSHTGQPDGLHRPQGRHLQWPGQRHVDANPDGSFTYKSKTGSSGQTDTSSTRPTMGCRRPTPTRVAAEPVPQPRDGQQSCDQETVRRNNQAGRGYLLSPLVPSLHNAAAVLIASVAAPRKPRARTPARSLSLRVHFYRSPCLRRSRRSSVQDDAFDLTRYEGFFSAPALLILLF